ncbi:MAG: aspartate-semialdehyde dehydrogenase [Candidatus Pacebacteria bacterium]|nr:aspartate-semialdehyde dehydrogenase [Candidatus Paceibacterota bacterium]
MKKYKVGILGATGMVGQNYIKLLEDHPWFDISYLAASPRTAGEKYGREMKDKWQMDVAMPENVLNIVLEDVGNVEKIKGKCDLVFSSFGMNSDEKIRDCENKYAKFGLPVVSSSSANRHTKDVPMIVPEVNSGHLEMIKIQKKNHLWDKGFIVTKPNCSLQSYIIPVYALMKAGYEVKKMIVTTLQAVSGGGYPGIASLDMIDNVVPYIGGEEEKSETEPLKVLGKIENGNYKNFDDLKISAHCNRVPVADGHLACVSMLFGKNKPNKSEIINIWRDFRPDIQGLNLPFAPSPTIIYKEEENRPQPKKDRQEGNGMAITIGRLRECNVFDHKFTCLSHNTIRGAAGGGILLAELLAKKRLI